MKTIKKLIVLLPAAFVFTGCTTSHSNKCGMIKWEYKTDGVSLGNPAAAFVVEYKGKQATAGSIAQQKLQDLGNEGWKLVSTIPNGDGSYTIFLERPKQ